MTEPNWRELGDPLDDRLPPENLLDRRRRKDLARIVGPRTLDDENVCTRCGVPDIHCQCPADPVIAWVGPVAILHGERDDSEMCLCGAPDYLTCPDWIAGNGTVSSLTFTSATCYYSLGHRNRHQCDCVCVRPAGHDGPHQCSAEVGL